MNEFFEYIDNNEFETLLMFLLVGLIISVLLKLYQYTNFEN